MPKILLVEDNDINRDMLSRRLERKGYQVIMAINGTEGVAKTLSDRPDIVLMDLHLPILDGWAATQQIKANPQTRAIPVIALTADAFGGEREKALAAGCDEYETKPVDLPRLLQKITKLIEPAAAQFSVTTNLSLDRHSQRSEIEQLRYQLDPPIYRIVSYSELLLEVLCDLPGDQLSQAQASDPASDIQKIHTSGMQLLQLVQAMLNPLLWEIQRQEIAIFAPILRLEILTPLSTIIGYCELLLEEATADLIPDLEQIYTSAQDLLSIANRLDSPIESQTSQQSIDTELPASPTTTARARSTQHSRILVIDDNEANSTLLSRQLARQGAQIAIATTDRATQTLSTIPYDLIVLDVSLPNISGFKLLAQLKRHEQWRQIPVLILAAPAEMDRLVRGVEMGAIDYLTKPVRSGLLHNKIAACLEHKRCLEQDGSFDRLFENAPVGVYQATIDGCYQRVNPALVKLLGYPTAVTLMTVIADIGDRIYVDANRYAQFKCLLEEHDQITGFEYQVYRHDGEQVWVAEHARAVRDLDGKLIYYEGIVEDISHRKLAETALNSQLAALQLELEHSQRVPQVAEIVPTDYFQQLQPHREAPEDRELDRSSSPLKVLLVEDNDLNSDMLSRRLERAGYHVVIAKDGAEGVSRALAELPDVILMDISLPVMDGWEATQQLKANPQTARIPVIALTAHAMAGDREKALAAGCNDYDTKPIELPRLLGKIEACLKRSISN
jgi:PAS domain S-box-containing protein